MTQAEVNTKSLDIVPQEAQKTALREFTDGPWSRFQDGSIWDSSLAYIVLLEAYERLTLALDLARTSIEDGLRNLIDLIPDQDKRSTGYRYIERLYSLRRDEIDLAVKLGAEASPKIEGMELCLEDALEKAVEDVFAQLGIRTPEDANEFVREQMGGATEYVRKELPDYPVDWYTLERTKERREQGIAEIRAKSARAPSQE